MHEHGLVDRLVKAALAEAARRGGRLVAVDVRLGAMATVAPDRLAADFDHLVRDHLGMDVALRIASDPERPSGVEIIGIELAAETAG